MFSNYKAQDGKVGKVRIYSDTSVVLNQIESGVYTLVINAIIKTIATIKKLDSLDKNFEKRVMDRTQKLRETVGQLDKEQVALKTEVESRKESELALRFQIFINRVCSSGMFSETIFQRISLSIPKYATTILHGISGCRALMSSGICVAASPMTSRLWIVAS
jgi:hypothetical protein